MIYFYFGKTWSKHYGKSILEQGKISKSKIFRTTSPGVIRKIKLSVRFATDEYEQLKQKAK